MKWTLNETSKKCFGKQINLCYELCLFWEIPYSDERCSTKFSCLMHFNSENLLMVMTANRKQTMESNKHRYPDLSEWKGLWDIDDCSSRLCVLTMFLGSGETQWWDTVCRSRSPYRQMKQAEVLAEGEANSCNLYLPRKLLLPEVVRLEPGYKFLQGEHFAESEQLQRSWWQ